MGYILGRLNKLYRNSGTYGSPTWVEITIARDVKTAFEKGEADASIRGSATAYAVATLLKAPVDFQLLYDHSDSNWQALETAFFANPGTDIEFAVADGAIATTGTNYFRAMCSIFKFEKGEPLEGVTMTDVTVKPTYSANAPTYVIAS